MAIIPNLAAVASAHSHMSGNAAPAHEEVAAASDDPVVLYSYRPADMIKAVLDAFTKATGIPVTLVVVRQDMISRFKESAKSEPADAILTEDIGRLARLKDENLLIPAQSIEITMNIPERLRSPGGFWIALTQRARIATVSRQRPLKIDVRSLADFAKPELKGRVCLRSMYHPCNIALIASIIAWSTRWSGPPWSCRSGGRSSRIPCRLTKS
ncbi:MAG: hypothetical protein VW268_04490 [Rhodospirillaceae bacterium]